MSKTVFFTALLCIAFFAKAQKITVCNNTLLDEKLETTSMVEQQSNQIQEPKPESSKAFIEGQFFKGLKITDIYGHVFDLKNTKGKVFVLNFWFIKCPGCSTEIPHLNKLVEEYKDKEVVFLAISTDEKNELKNFAKKNSFNYNIIDGRYIAEKYGVKLFPTHVVVGENGIIKFSSVGFDQNTVYWIKKEIDQALKRLSN